MAQEISYPAALQELTVHRAWESVLRGDTHAASQLRSLIGHSWRRCLDAQVDPNRDKAPDLISPDSLAQLHEQQHDMVQASAPIMALARDYLSETGSIMILADASGTILASEGDHSVQDAASGIHLMPGARWSEALCGTNAIGTALEVGEPVQIHSAEHFCAGIKRWTCAATVVRHPTDGDILGAVDVSGLSSTFSPQSLALAVTTAKRIESRLALDELERRYRLLDVSLNRLSAAASSGAVLFDRRGTAIKANAGAQAGILAADGPADWLRSLRRLSALAQWRQGSPVPLGLPHLFRGKINPPALMR
ncbi:MAG: GAF domain-containing protein [Pseudomonadota bacterium]|nr:GAF domain-containing protein [Pseudomonadota bacterium]